MLFKLYFELISKLIEDQVDDKLMNLSKIMGSKKLK